MSLLVIVTTLSLFWAIVTLWWPCVRRRPHIPRYVISATNDTYRVQAGTIGARIFIREYMDCPVVTMRGYDSPSGQSDPT